jgi:sulfoxide reductase catalytic subunit YedY
MNLEFSIGVRLTHFFNFLFLSLLVRSGIEILGAHPKLYWRDHCSPGSEWLRFTRKKMPDDALWTKDACRACSSGVDLHAATFARCTG